LLQKDYDAHSELLSNAPTTKRKIQIPRPKLKSRSQIRIRSINADLISPDEVQVDNVTIRTPVK